MKGLPRGAEAETWAQRHLEGRGLKLLARNWRYAGGELDLVMREGATLVVVEVRQRAATTAMPSNRCARAWFAPTACTWRRTRSTPAGQCAST
jgi:Holliday junction resolvase-like predicted endonuclease